MEVLDRDHLVNALLNTLSVDGNERRSSEEYLKRSRLRHGFLSLLLEVLTTGEDEAVCMTAAITLKNEIRSRWVSYQELGILEQFERRSEFMEKCEDCRRTFEVTQEPCSKCLPQTGTISSNVSTAVPSNEPPAHYEESEKKIIRLGLIELCSRIPLSKISLRRQIDECLCRICAYDFPKTCPEFSDIILKCLTQRQDQMVIVAGLCIYRAILKRLDSDTKEFEALAATLGPLLIQIVQDITAAPGGTGESDGVSKIYQTQESSFILKMINKIYSVLTFDPVIPSPYLISSQAQWMQLLRLTIKTTPPLTALLPPNIAPEGPHSVIQILPDGRAVLRESIDPERSFAMKAKKWALRSIQRFFSRYGSANHSFIKNNGGAFGVTFIETFAPEIIKDLFELQMAAVGNGIPIGFKTHGAGPNLVEIENRLRQQILPEKHQCRVLEIFSSALSKSHCYKLLKPSIEALIAKVIHPLLCYQEDDVQKFESSPVEYAKNLFQYFHPYQPKEAACKFIESMMRYRSRDFLTPVATFIQNIFQQYQQAAAQSGADFGVGSEICCKKEGALVLLGEFSERLVSKKRQLNIESLAWVHIYPELMNEHDKFVRLRSAWAYGVLFDPEVNTKTKVGVLDEPDKFLEAFMQMCRLAASDKEIPIRCQAAAALSTFIRIPNTKLQEHVKQNLLKLVDTLLSVFEITDVKEPVATLTDLMAQFPDDIAPVAVKVITFLVDTILRFAANFTVESPARGQIAGQATIETPGHNASPITEESPLSAFSGLGNTAGRGGDDDDDEDIGFTTSTVFKAINIVLDGVVKQNEVMAQCVPKVLMLLDWSLKPEALDFLDQSLQILATITFREEPKLEPPFHDSYWICFERLYQAVCGGNSQHCVLPEVFTEGWAADELQDMLPAFDNYIQQPAWATGNSTMAIDGSPMSYKAMTLKIIERTINGEFDPESTTWSLQLIWIILDSYCDSLVSIQDIIPQLCVIVWNLIKVKGSPPPKQPKGTKREDKSEDEADEPLSDLQISFICRIFATLLYAAPKDFLALSESSGNLQTTIQYLLSDHTLKTEQGKKIFILAFVSLTRLVKSGQLSLNPIVEGLVNEALIRVPAQISTLIALKDTKDEDADQDCDSEQDLEETQDAQPTNSYFMGKLLSKLKNAPENEEDDDDEDSDDSDFHVNPDEELGLRLSPLDSVNEFAVVSNWLTEFSDQVVSRIGADEARSLLAEVSKRCE